MSGVNSASRRRNGDSSGPPSSTASATPPASTRRVDVVGRELGGDLGRHVGVRLGSDAGEQVDDDVIALVVDIARHVAVDLGIDLTVDLGIDLDVDPRFDHLDVSQFDVDRLDIDRDTDRLDVHGFDNNALDVGRFVVRGLDIRGRGVHIGLVGRRFGLDRTRNLLPNLDLAGNLGIVEFVVRRDRVVGPRGVGQHHRHGAGGGRQVHVLVGLTERLEFSDDVDRHHTRPLERLHQAVTTVHQLFDLLPGELTTTGELAEHPLAVRPRLVDHLPTLLLGHRQLGFGIGGRVGSAS